MFLSGKSSSSGKAISGKSILSVHDRPAVWGNYWQDPSGPEHHNLSYNLYDNKQRKTDHVTRGRRCGQCFRTARGLTQHIRLAHATQHHADGHDVSPSTGQPRNVEHLVGLSCWSSKKDTMHFDHIQRDEFKPRWLMERANWPAFTSTISDLIQANTHTSEDINVMAHNLTETITKAANLHIPKSKVNGPKRKYWCYDPLVQTAKRR